MASKNNKSSDSKVLQIITHVLGLITYFIGPLIIMLVAEDKVTKNHARASLNWQISLIIYYIIALILVFFFIGILFMIALWIINLIFCIIAAVKASEGEIYNYPLTIQFFKLE